MGVPTASAYPAALDSAITLFGAPANQKSFTLATDIDNSVTSFAVNEDISALTAPAFLTFVTGEIVYFEAKNNGSKTFSSLTRGAVGSVAASHTSGEVVRMTLVAEYIIQLVRAMIAVETELGVDPRGDWDSVVDRLNNHNHSGEADDATADTLDGLHADELGSVITVENLQGRDVDDAAPAHGDLLSWDSSANKWKPLSWIYGQNLTNKSGATVDAGDLVTIDATNASAFTTTTAVGAPQTLGVVAETIANDATGKIYFLTGTLVTVNCDTGAVAIGQFLRSSATAKKATGSGYFRNPGDFALAISSKSAGSNGTVQAILIDNFRQAFATGYGWAFGGWTTTYSTNAQKLTMAAGTWATISGAALPAARYEMSGFNETTVNAFAIGGTDGTRRTTAYKMPYSTETTAAQSSADLATARDRLGSGIGGSLAGYVAGGYNGSAELTTIDKILFSTATRSAAAGVLSSIRGYQHGQSDGTYCYISGGTSTVADRFVFSNDTCAAHTDANLANTSTAYTSLSFPSLSGYMVMYNSPNNYCRKLPYASAIASNMANQLINQHAYGAGVTNGSSLGWVSGSSAGSSDVSDKLTQATEVFATDTGALMSLGKYSAARASYGVYS